MSNPTSNFGWQMPTNTDLVSQLPADFEVFGQAVDTSLADLKGGTTGQVLAKASNADMDFVWSADAAGMTNPMTTTGDTIYSSSGSTPARLGIGSTGQVLTVSGGLPAWSTPSSGSMTLLSTTSIAGVSSVTVSTIDQTYTHLQIMVEDFYMTSNDKTVAIRLNGDTGSNYFGSFDTVNANSFQTSGILYTSYPATDSGNNFVIDVPFYTNTANSKMVKASYTGVSTTGAGYWRNVVDYGVSWKSQAAISSFTLLNATDSTTFAAGSIKIYGVK